jgi:hypothetical protein
MKSFFLNLDQQWINLGIEFAKKENYHCAWICYSGFDDQQLNFDLIKYLI